MTTTHALVVALLAGFTLSTAQAQPVFRCGNAYSQLPCGNGRTVEVADVRGPAQQDEARKVAASERQLAAAMRQGRLADERAAAFAGAASLSGSPAQSRSERPASTAATSRKKKSAAESSYLSDPGFVASAPASRKRRHRD